MNFRERCDHLRFDERRQRSSRARSSSIPRADETILSPTTRSFLRTSGLRSRPDHCRQRPPASPTFAPPGPTFRRILGVGVPGTRSPALPGLCGFRWACVGRGMTKSGWITLEFCGRIAIPSGMFISQGFAQVQGAVYTNYLLVKSVHYAQGAAPERICSWGTSVREPGRRVAAARA